MKLAEALMLRADCQTRLEAIKARLIRNCKVQEGDKPAEDPKDLLKELEQAAADLLRLISRVNATNAATPFGEGMTLSDALARRDVLRARHGVYADLARAATVTQERYSRSEVKFKSAVNVAEVQRRADDLAREYRELDARVQEANWITELVE
ncbi:MAG: DIP1984 family protein [Planctomycetes bacterium]|nr:DIP1984 family protein [Planctomycetota bacterium]